jgi:hypothetical protein
VQQATASRGSRSRTSADPSAFQVVFGPFLVIRTGQPVAQAFLLRGARLLVGQQPGSATRTSTRTAVPPGAPWLRAVFAPVRATRDTARSKPRGPPASAAPPSRTARPAAAAEAPPDPRTHERVRASSAALISASASSAARRS